MYIVHKQVVSADPATYPYAKVLPSSVQELDGMSMLTHRYVFN